MVPYDLLAVMTLGAAIGAGSVDAFDLVRKKQPVLCYRADVQKYVEQKRKADVAAGKVFGQEHYGEMRDALTANLGNIR